METEIHGVGWDMNGVIETRFEIVKTDGDGELVSGCGWIWGKGHLHPWGR